MDAFPSKLDDIVYRCWTYFVLPVFFVGSLYLIFSSSVFEITMLWFPIVCFLQILGLHFKNKVSYWANFLFILVLAFIIYAFKETILKPLYQYDIISAGLMGALHGGVIACLFWGWYKVKLIFYPIKFEDINWNDSNVGKVEKDTTNTTKIIWVIISLFIIGLLYVIYNDTQRNRVNVNKAINQSQNEVLPSYSNANVNPLVTSNISNNTITEQLDNNTVWYQEVSRQIPDLQKLLSEPDFISFLNTKGNEAYSLINYAGEHRDVSMIPKIRALIDEYKNMKSAKVNSSAMENLAFGCDLTDGRRVYVHRGNNEYLYAIFGKQGNVELNFFNTAQQIQNNSLLHKNGVTLVMQNGTYQYRISGQGTKTTLFVYNGDKGISTHYCQNNSDYWNLQNLPLLSVNAGSKSHIKYCKQIINEGLYLAKMSKQCPNEMQGITLSVEDTALFFDSEGCGYLIQNNQKQQQDMIVSLSDKLNKSIETKAKKLGNQFCAKESTYARKMAERYHDFFNGR